MKSVVHTLFLETKLDLLSALRTPGFVVPAVAFPVLLYLFFGIFMVQDKPQSSVEISTYTMINYMVFGLMAPSLFNFGAHVAQERESGWLELKLLSPMPTVYYLFAKSLSAVAFTVVISVLLFVFAWLLGGVQLDLLQLTALLVLAVVGTVPFCLLGLTLGLKFTAKAASAITNLVFLPMAMLSGLWLPIFLMPEFLQQFAWLLPSYHLSQLGLACVGLGQGYSGYFHFFALLLMCLVFLMLAAFQYKKVGSHEKKASSLKKICI
ncbi:ABC transporter permease [Pseudoalteromonas sp. SMS1]|uniref:ABC transporter permease n=1 Tax=Pseudoalteromonas sp. SMS1 TaxID=2908894 RepID=UPI001F3E5DDE|nr:ABC transporter permease [Pseudoalteromonas sp. SMS1]MCF2857741.1 ABC transporter permease [Pseudoalteromonas sp. SMS1]